MSDEREAYGGGKHPPYCTCADCAALRTGAPPPPKRNYYEILDVRRDASTGEIQEAYHKKKFDYDPARIETRAKEINQAYDVLRGRVRRPRYDRSHYCMVLGVGPHATEQQIRNAYRKKASEYHPDRAAAALKECEEAYATLRDPAKRARYDGVRTPPSPPPRAEPPQRPPGTPPKAPTETPPPPPEPPPEPPTETPSRSPKPPKSGCGPRAAIALLVLVIAAGAGAYFGGFLDSTGPPPPEVVVVTATPTPTPFPTPTPAIVPATSTPTPVSTALPTPIPVPEAATTPTASPQEIWEAADKAVHGALAAYEAAEGAERTAALEAYIAAQAVEAHAFAVWQSLPTPTPLPPTATRTPGPPTATPSPTPEPTSTPTPRPTATPTPRPTATPTPRPTATPTPRPTATPTPRPTATPAPTLRQYREYFLELINEARAEAGVPAVTLGDNRAPQLQAESSLENCFGGHWGLDGLKPYMRYSLAGGYQSNGENALGFYFCPRNVRALPSIEQVVRDAMDSWMKSSGHRRNILDPWHRKVSIGFAWNRHYYAAYQHFEGDYVEYDRLPMISANGTLSLSGRVKNGVRLGGREDLSVQIYYDPPPRTLTPSQTSATSCYSYGVRAASLRYPLTGDWYWTEDSYVDTSVAFCPAPRGDPLSVGNVVPWITARTWNVTPSSFSVTADLSGVIDKHGPGVYSVVVWGTIGSEDVVISEYSIFYQITPPDTYDPSA